ncbi:MAG: TIGR03619 family F420-dependent LLM class oxidoreductase [Chloroflexi bacterium]|nr:TIGR03619 family F420-dependent LLM class oxidoreductase [Chloroflexota bacterium]
MQYGFALPSFGPGFAWRDDLAHLARAAEDLGLDSIWLADHVVMPMEIRSAYPFGPGGRFTMPSDHDWLEPVTTLAYLAGVTRRVRLGTAVMVPALRHPLLNAKMLATVDVLAGGRLVLGLGAGWLLEEFRLLGWSDDIVAHRGAVADEHLRIYRTVWTADEPRFAGRWWQFEGLYVRPRPPQPGGPPLWIGGHSAAAFRRVARLGDGWIGVWPEQPEQLAADVAGIRQACAARGRDPAELTLCLRAAVRFRDAAPERRRPNALLGPPDHIRREIDGAAALGVGYVVADAWGLDREDTLRTMERFAREVAEL